MKKIILIFFCIPVINFAAKINLIKTDRFEKVLFKSDSIKFLLLDNRIIEKTENVKLEVGKVYKHPNNPLFVEEKEWEMRFDNLYGNVIFDKDEEIYKLWYSPFIVDSKIVIRKIETITSEYAPPPKREMGICYASS